MRSGFIMGYYSEYIRVGNTIIRFRKCLLRCAHGIGMQFTGADRVAETRRDWA